MSRGGMTYLFPLSSRTLSPTEPVTQSGIQFWWSVCLSSGLELRDQGVAKEDFLSSRDELGLSETGKQSWAEALCSGGQRDPSEEWAGADIAGRAGRVSVRS